VILCIVTKMAGLLVVALAALSIISQMMHSRIFESSKKQQNYSHKSSVRDAKSILILYRCAMSLLLFLFCFVLIQIFEEDAARKIVRRPASPTMTRQLLTFLTIGFCTSGVNVIVAKNVSQLFKHFFYKTFIVIADFFITIALFATTVSLATIFCNTFMIIAYCLMYLEEVVVKPGQRSNSMNKEFLTGSGIDEDEDNSSLEDNTLIDFVKVIWEQKYTRRIALFF